MQRPLLLLRWPHSLERLDLGLRTLKVYTGYAMGQPRAVHLRYHTCISLLTCYIALYQVEHAIVSISDHNITSFGDAQPEPRPLLLEGCMDACAELLATNVTDVRPHDNGCGYRRPVAAPKLKHRHAHPSRLRYQEPEAASTHCSRGVDCERTRPLTPPSPARWPERIDKCEIVAYIENALPRALHRHGVRCPHRVDVDGPTVKVRDGKEAIIATAISLAVATAAATKRQPLDVARSVEAEG